MFQHRTQNELCMWNSKVQRARFGQPLRFAASHLSTACVRGIFHSATLLDLGIFLKQLALRLSRCHASEQIYLVLYMAELVEAALLYKLLMCDLGAPIQWVRSDRPVQSIDFL